ncbi:MAG: AMP-binding protein, partial [Pseudomonadota bacterium]|nr:AMP-binding protein [Pseudomonadota bacterium]
MEQPIWHPSDKRIADSNMQQFLRRKNVNANNYHQLYEWSIERPDQFWGEFAEFSGILFGSFYEKVVENMKQMPGAQWVKGCSLNYAANLLKSEYTGTAIIFYGERGERIELTWNQLRDQVASISKKLRDLGVKPGDRVAGYLPNRPETVIAMLATTSIGGVWSSCSPDLGISSTVDRFGQIKPKVLFATDGYFYNGKTINSLTSVTEIVKQLPTLKHLVIVPYVNNIPDIRLLPKAILFRELLEEKAILKFEHLPFDHPLCILYSSGTTSNPKCIVHGAGGTLIQHQKEQMLHTDIKPGDKVFYFTTCGWMMWNWLISTLASGATVILFDGSPFYPNAGALWDIAEREKLTVFGTSAKYLRTLEKSHYNPRQHVELNSLKSILSTGSPLAPSSFDFVYNQIKGDL